MATTTYELGVPSGGTAFTGAANREDLLDIITIMSPVDAPCFTMFRKTKVSNVQVEWLVDSLSAAASDAVADGSSAAFQAANARPRLLNYTQISREAFDVSDSQRAVNPEHSGAPYRKVRMITRPYAGKREHPQVRLAA